jgi:hypothetical protein
VAAAAAGKARSQPMICDTCVFSHSVCVSLICRSWLVTKALPLKFLSAQNQAAAIWQFYKLKGEVRAGIPPNFMARGCRPRVSLPANSHHCVSALSQLLQQVPCIAQTLHERVMCRISHGLARCAGSTSSLYPTVGWVRAVLPA